MEIMVKETRESFARRHGNGNAEADVMESTHFSDSSSDKISYNNVSFQACDENNDHKNQLENELRSELLQLQHNLDITKRVEVYYVNIPGLILHIYWIAQLAGTKL